MPKKPQRLPILQSVVKKLFAYTGNQCAMPNCKEVIVDESGTMLGKIAHICAAEPGGPRYDSSMSDNERRSYRNLFIICGKHHDLIDDRHNLDRYPAIDLLRFKNEHEGRFKTAENQLIEQFVDHTQINQPTYPKTLKALDAAFSTNLFENDQAEIAGVHSFVDKLKECPLDERNLALALATRMRRQGTDKLLFDDIVGALKISKGSLKRRVDLLEHHGLAYVLDDLEPGKYFVKLFDRRTGFNPWIEVLEFCDATGTSVDELIRELNFALYDEL
jgi:hypothetical protein